MDVLMVVSDAEETSAGAAGTGFGLRGDGFAVRCTGLTDGVLALSAVWRCS